MSEPTDKLIELMDNKDLTAKAKAGDKDAQKEVLISLHKIGQDIITNEEFKAQFDSMKKIADERGDDELHLMFVLNGRNNNLSDADTKKISQPVLFADWPPENKEKAMYGLGARFAEENPDTMLTSILQISEAWMVKRKNGENIDNIAPSQEDDRVEVVVIAAQTFDHRYSTWGGEIIRDKDGKFTGYETVFEDMYDPENPSSPNSQENHLSNYLYAGYMAARVKKFDSKDDDDKSE